MSSLTEYLRLHASCCPPEEGEVDVIFCGISTDGRATAETLKKHIEKHPGVIFQMDPLDGLEHNFLEIGGWIGDRSDALMLIGLGVSLGLWTLITPKTLIGNHLPPSLIQQMARIGMVSIKADPGLILKPKIPILF